MDRRAGLNVFLVRAFPFYILLHTTRVQHQMFNYRIAQTKEQIARIREWHLQLKIHQSEMRHILSVEGMRTKSVARRVRDTRHRRDARR